MSAPDRLSALFQAIDSSDAAAFAEHLDEQAVFRFGNAPPVIGRAAIREAVAAFFGAVRSLSHRVEESWSAGDAVICRGDVTYTRHDGSSLTLPFANIFKLRGGLIGEYLIYADISPLFAAE